MRMPTVSTAPANDTDRCIGVIPCRGSRTQAPAIERRRARRRTRTRLGRTQAAVWAAHTPASGSDCPPPSAARVSRSNRRSRQETAPGSRCRTSTGGGCKDGPRSGLDRQVCRVGHLVEVGGGVGLQHRPERSGRFSHVPGPRATCSTKCSAASGWAPELIRWHDREIGVIGRQRSDERLVGRPSSRFDRDGNRHIAVAPCKPVQRGCSASTWVCAKVTSRFRGRGGRHGHRQG